jgi:hypothetical protein
VTWHAIIVNRATPAQKEQVRAAVRRHAAGWWHNFTDLWIVGGEQSAVEWRDLVAPIFPYRPSGVAVFKLDTEWPAWALKATLSEPARDWLQKHL